MQVPEETASALAPSFVQALVGAVLVLASLALVPALRALAHRLVPERRILFARWGFFHVGLGMLTFFGFTLAVVQGFAAAGVDLAGNAFLTVVAGTVPQLATVALVASFAHRLDPDGIRSLGLRLKGSLSGAVLGLGTYAAIAPGIAGAMLLSRWLWAELGVDAPPQELLSLAAELEGPELVGFLVLGALVIPLFEELVFRGFLQPLLVQNLGDRGGVAVTALVFAAVHGNVFAFLPIFVLALALGTLMLRTQRIAAPFVVHALHNGLTLYLVTSTDFGSQLGG